MGLPGLIIPPKIALLVILNVLEKIVQICRILCAEYRDTPFYKPFDDNKSLKIRRTNAKHVWKKEINSCLCVSRECEDIILTPFLRNRKTLPQQYEFSEDC